jgi:hypothetical protein
MAGDPTTYIRERRGLVAVGEHPQDPYRAVSMSSAAFNGTGPIGSDKAKSIGRNTRFQPTELSGELP